MKTALGSAVSATGPLTFHSETLQKFSTANMGSFATDHNESEKRCSIRRTTRQTHTQINAKFACGHNRVFTGWPSLPSLVFADEALDGERADRRPGGVERRRREGLLRSALLGQEVELSAHGTYVEYTQVEECASGVLCSCGVLQGNVHPWNIPGMELHW